MKIDETTLVCPNGHSRKFLANHTSVAWKVVKGADGKLAGSELKGKGYGHVVLYHCADCGAAIVFEIDKEGDIVEG